MNNKLLLIDGNSLMHRAFYAMPLMSTSTGEYTNAVYGFVNLLVKAITDYSPTYIAIAFDVKKNTFRNDIYADYKATRKSMPDELREQMPLLKELLKVMNIAIVEKDGFEGDDIIGTLAKRFDGVNTSIISGDRDLLQLVDDNVSVILTKKGLSDIIEITPNNILDFYGVNACNVIDLKALMGDSSDNIPGVKGVGEVTAKKIISEYKTIENVYKNIDNFTGKLKEKLQNSKEDAFISKTLATIVTNAEVKAELDDLKFQYPFSKNVYSFLQKYEFNSLLRRANIFDLQSKVEEIKPKKQINQNTVTTEWQFEILREEILNSKCFSFFQEKNNIFVSTNSSVDNIIPIKKDIINECLDVDVIYQSFKPLFENENITKVVFDSKTLKHNLIKSYQISVVGEIVDVAIMAYCNGVAPVKSFQELLLQNGLDDSNYFGANMFEIKNIYDCQIEQSNIKELFEVESCVSNILFEMEQNGFKLDKDLVYSTGMMFENKIAQVKQKIFEVSGESFNVNSTQELGKILFEKLGLSTTKKTKSGYSTDIESLQAIFNQHEIVPLIVEYRKLAKINSTYIEGMKPLMDENGFVHTEFKQLLTVTGRLSSVEPNLQNIPIKDEEGQKIRKFFVPSNVDGYLVGADYSQIELRLLAHFSEDKNLISAYENNLDIHAKTASLVFDVDINDVSKSQRRTAKTINFGVIYGMGEHSLSKDLKISRQEAKQYIDKYFAEYSSVKAYMNNEIEFCKNNGYVFSMLGRKRFIPEIKSPNFNLRGFGERAAMNMRLQASAADVIKKAMVKVNQELKENKLKSKLILQVHDELIVDCVKEEVEKVSVILKEQMENVFEFKVPLVANVKIMKNWFDEE